MISTVPWCLGLKCHSVARMLSNRQDPASVIKPKCQVCDRAASLTEIRWECDYLRAAELFVLDKLKFISTFGRLTLAGFQVPSKSHSPAGQWRENKMKNNLWVEIRQFAEAKVKVCMCTTKENIYSLLPISKWYSGHFQCSGCSGKQIL